AGRTARAGCGRDQGGRGRDHSASRRRAAAGHRREPGLPDGHAASRRGEGVQGDQPMKDVRLHAGIPVKPVYGPEDVSADFERDIGRPGEYPFTRGIHRPMYCAVAEKQGAAPDRVVTTPQNDILKEFVARGTWVYPVEPSLRLVADLIEFSARHYPRSNPVSVCGYHIREAGCTTAQEMAYGLAIAAAYVELMQARGMAVDDFA